MKMRLRGKKAGDVIAQGVIWTILAVSLVIFSVPFLFMISNSFEQFSFVLPYPPKLLPTKLDFSAYTYVLSQPFFPTRGQKQRHQHGGHGGALGVYLHALGLRLCAHRLSRAGNAL
jgi:ABC-type glycerol-3-phosphate transport system permease component